MNVSELKTFLSQNKEPIAITVPLILRETTFIPLYTIGENNMILPFRGHGYLVVVFYFGALVLTQLTVDLFEGKGFYTSNSWPKYLAVGIGALICWLVGKWLNSGKVPKRFKDLDTGQEIIVPPKYHEFLYIRMEYWGLVGAAACIIITVLIALGVVRF
jgi:hypothetical protein